ncbi:thymidylate synthase [Aliarcobacter butzleri]
MIFITEDSFNILYYKLLELSYYKNIQESNSRVGEVRDLGKVVYQIKNDSFRLCFFKDRNINPFFALTEFSWIIEGSDLVEPLQYFIKDYDKFSDDNVTLNGAYGFRILKYFNSNQLEKAISELNENRESRRVVLTMYSPNDLNKTSKDIPCNTTIYLKIKDNKLDITILNRSNDLYLGVPYNVFVFYLLQLYIAEKINSDIGTQTHFTDSLHVYTKDLGKVEEIINNNSLEEIEYIENNIRKFDISQYISENHKKILEKDYCNLNLDIFKKIFKIIENIKNNHNIDFYTIPENLMGYVVYNWLKQKKDINFQMMDYFENINKRIELKNTQLLESLKTKKKSEIINVVDKLNNELLPNFLDLKNLIACKQGIISLDLSNESKIINIALFVIIIEGVAEYIYDREVRESLMKKIKGVMSIYGIDLEEVSYFNKYEEEIRNFINSEK